MPSRLLPLATAARCAACIFTVAPCSHVKAVWLHKGLPAPYRVNRAAYVSQRGSSASSKGRREATANAVNDVDGVFVSLMLVLLLLMLLLLVELAVEDEAIAPS